MGFDSAPVPTAPHWSVSWLLGQFSLPGHIQPEHTALRWVDGSRTYGELRTRVLQIAHSLRARGAVPGDRVAVHLYNRGETFELYFACAYAGLTLVPINFRLSAREIAFILDDCSPCVLITEAELAATAHDGVASAAAPTPEMITFATHEGGPHYEVLIAGAELMEFAHNDIHLLLYTSGTTGRPKGVIMKHDNILAFAMQQRCYYDHLDGNAVLMVTGPTYNTAGINEQSIPTFLAGGTVVIMPSRGWKPERMTELMDQWGVTHALIYPSMMEPMFAADAERRSDLSTLRFVLTGGENCPPALMQRFIRRWPHIVLTIAYGSTETGCPTMIKNDEILAHPGSVGRSTGVQTFCVLGPDRTVLAPGEVGEIWTAGPTTVPGYWQAPELDAAVLVDGWVNTGDLGRIDEDGYLFIEGRSRDMIISKGQNIYPAEIESVLNEHPDILDVAVIGVAEPEFGEAVCACVVVKAGQMITSDDLAEFTRERLASYKKPRFVITVPELPRSPSGKVLKAELASSIAGELEASR